MAWAETNLNYPVVPSLPPWAGTPYTRPACLGPLNTSEDEHPQIL